MAGYFEGAQAGAQEERMRRLDSIRQAQEQQNALYHQAVAAIAGQKATETGRHNVAGEELGGQKVGLAALGTQERGRHNVATEEAAQGGLGVRQGQLDVLQSGQKLKEDVFGEAVRHHKAMEARPTGGAQKQSAAATKEIADLQDLNSFAQSLYDEMPKFKEQYGPGARAKLSAQEYASGIPGIGRFFSPGGMAGAPKGWEEHQSGLQNVLMERAHKMGGARAVSTAGARQAFERFHPDINRGYEYNRERMQELLHYVNIALGHRGAGQSVLGQQLPPMPGSQDNLGVAPMPPPIQRGGKKKLPAGAPPDAYAVPD